MAQWRTSLKYCSGNLMHISGKSFQLKLVGWGDVPSLKNFAILVKIR